MNAPFVDSIGYYFLVILRWAVLQIQRLQALVTTDGADLPVLDTRCLKINNTGHSYAVVSVLLR